MNLKKSLSFTLYMGIYSVSYCSTLSIFIAGFVWISKMTVFSKLKPWTAMSHDFLRLRNNHIKHKYACFLMCSNINIG